MVENPPCSARDMGSIPGPGRSHILWNNYVCDITTEPAVCNQRSHCNEKPTDSNEVWPPLTATRESPRIATKKDPAQPNK